MDYIRLQNDYQKLSKKYKEDLKKISDLNETKLKSLQKIIANKTEEYEAINVQLKKNKEKYDKDLLEWKQAKMTLEKE